MICVLTSTRSAVGASSSRNILNASPSRQQTTTAVGWRAQCAASRPRSIRVHSRRDPRDVGVRLVPSPSRVRSPARDGRMRTSLKEDTDTAEPPSPSPSSLTYSPPPYPPVDIATSQQLRRAGVAASLAVMAIAAGEFGLLALDLQTTHVFASAVDVTVHQSVLASTSEEVRTYVAPRVISDIFPTLGFGCLVGSTVGARKTQKKRSWDFRSGVEEVVALLYVTTPALFVSRFTTRTIT